MGLVALMQGKVRDVEQEAVTLLQLQFGKTDKKGSGKQVETDVNEPQKPGELLSVDKIPVKSFVSLVVNHEVSAIGICQSVKEEEVEKTDPSQIVFVKEEDYDCQRQGDMYFEDWTNRSDDKSCQPSFKIIKNKPGEKHNGPRKVIPGSNGIMYASAVAKAYLDIMLSQEIWIDKVNRTSVGKSVRTIYKEAWGHIPDGHLGRLVKTAINRAVEDYKLKVGGFTGMTETPEWRLTDEEETVCEVLKLDKAFQMQGIKKNRKLSTIRKGSSFFLETQHDMQSM